MNKKSYLFWQPGYNLIKLLTGSTFGNYLLVFLNYSIWIFFFAISYILVKQNPNNFWQLLFATIISEIVERFIKSKVFWRRPLFNYTSHTPPGLVDKWYKTGSFPSGHTIKTIIFFLLIIQHQSINPALFWLVTLPLLVFRVLAGFHYPIDMIGGAFIGAAIWAAVYQIQMPPSLNLLVQRLFNFIFLVK